MLTLPKAAVSQWPLAWSVARAVHFSLQHRALPWIEFALTGRKRALPPDPKSFVKHAYGKLFELLKQDTENIQNGVYPAAVLKPENPLLHWKHTLDILLDGVSIARRRKNNVHNEFAKDITEMLDKFPDYYKRNFHFQTDGYFSEHSANIYEHQVEILFAGAADPMRRLLIPLLKNRFQGDGDGLRFLEIGSGTGRLTKFVKLAYPKAHVTVLEASGAYLSKSQNQLKDFKGVDFMQGFGEDLPFKDQHFDAVYSCFMFHELPMLVRKKILGEAYRVLKSQGVFGFVDSLQINDDQNMDWALTQFPKDFHEPFFMDYIKQPMEELLFKAGFTGEIAKNTGFLSKALLVEK
jgi:ubiquinone/menaquinone biosynthesis C-methylase UbiE